MQQALLVHNKSAGEGHLGPSELAMALEASGLAVRHCDPQDSDIDQYLGEHSDIVVLAGGDGTVARMLAKLPSQNRVVAIVALGTANNIAQSLGILDPGLPGSGNEIVTAWRHANRQPLDIGYVTGPWGETRFVEALGIGPLAKTILQFKTKGVSATDSIRLGREAFRHALAHAQPLLSVVKLDGVLISGPLLLMEAMNIQHGGSRLCLAPEAKLGDGYLDVVTIAPEQREAVIKWVDSGCNDKSPVTVMRAQKVEIDWCGDALRIDDFGPKTDTYKGRITLTLLPQQLDILVPSEKDRTQSLSNTAEVESRNMS